MKTKPESLIAYCRLLQSDAEGAVYKERFDDIISLLKKQIPKKFDRWSSKCGCGHFINNWSIKYCPFCGQRIDWGDEDD